MQYSIHQHTNCPLKSTCGKASLKITWKKKHQKSRGYSFVAYLQKSRDASSIVAYLQKWRDASIIAYLNQERGYHSIQKPRVVAVMNDLTVTALYTQYKPWLDNWMNDNDVYRGACYQHSRFFTSQWIMFSCAPTLVKSLSAPTNSLPPTHTHINKDWRCGLFTADWDLEFSLILLLISFDGKTGKGLVGLKRQTSSWELFESLPDFTTPLR